MEKTITIDGREVRLKTNGATPLRYKTQFKRDYLADVVKLMKLLGAFAGGESTEELESDVVFNIAWVYAKTADATIAEPMAWLESFDEFPLLDVLVDVAELAANSLKTSKKK